MKQLAIIAVVQSLAALLLAAIWFWYSCWHIAGVEAMAEDLIIDGYITQAAADSARGEAASLGVHLQQGYDGRVLISGLLLSAAAILGPCITLAAAKFIAVAQESNNPAPGGRTPETG